jgi:cell filamentation protein
MSDRHLSKYTVSDSEAGGEVIPNLLQLTNVTEVAESEFIGFVQAQQKAIDGLSDETKFDLKYLYALHHDALGHLYSFAGKLRTVNMSKDGFTFPPAHFLPQAMQNFETDFLITLQSGFSTQETFVLHIARLHAELLFIHPFREGNGRTIRLFTNLLSIAKTGYELNFEILEENIERYIVAVQQASQHEYSLMEELFSEMSSLRH